MRIRFSLLMILAIITRFQVSAQDTANINDPVKWTFSTEQQNGKLLVHAKASIASGWKLFSTSMKDDEPNTRIVFDSAMKLQPTALQETGNLKTGKDENLGDLSIKYFEKEADISFVADINTSVKDIRGAVVYMAIKGQDVVGPETVAFRFGRDNITGNFVSRNAGLEVSAASSAALKRTAIDFDHPINNCGGTGGENTRAKSLWGIFVLGFLGGLVGLIMPCTFPMIPLTVSFFTKRSGSQKKGIFNAFLYGFFIFLIYVLLSLPFYFLNAGSSDILNNISTNAWLNIIFAVIFIAFALSFFGLYEIALPSSLSNTVDSKSDVSSIGGIFFMALTLAIVSFSCTGPILGSLLVGALNQNGGSVQLTVAMAGFGLALGLPFALFALFPNWLASLPKSGGWMNTVKIVFGFLELALALKFLSNADLVKHWGLLKRETFFGIWVVIGVALTLYLFGILKFSYDPPPKKLGKFRIAIGVIFLAFTLYLVPGLFNSSMANRSLISGFPPPLTYSIYAHDSLNHKGVEANVVNDYEGALALAKVTHKPILIDFTGWACVNCRKMEENVWTNPNVKALIEKDFILVSLYVDDRKLLPDSAQFSFPSSDGTKKNIRTIGDKYITLQSENFRNASQPLYAIISPDEQLLNLPVGYTPNAVSYAAWLNCGKSAMDKLQMATKKVPL